MILYDSHNSQWFTLILSDSQTILGNSHSFSVILSDFDDSCCFLNNFGWFPMILTDSQQLSNGSYWFLLILEQFLDGFLLILDYLNCFMILNGSQIIFNDSFWFLNDSQTIPIDSWMILSDPIDHHGFFVWFLVFLMILTL